MISTKKINIKTGINIVLIICAFTLFTGCGAQKEAESEPVILAQEEAPMEYTLAIASIEDVQLKETINCVYRQTLDEEISFSVSGKKIEKVYVNTGDAVTKGQLLAELKNGNAQEEIQRLEYQINRNKLLLQYVDVNEKNDIDEKWAQFNYNSDGTEETRVKVNKEIEELKQANRYSREDYQDAIDSDQKQLDALNADVNACRVYAGIDGTVSQIMPGIEGATSTQGEIIMTVIDGSEGVFVSDAIEFAPYFEEGKSLEVIVGVGMAAEPYEVIPYQRNEWNEEMYFEVKTVGDGVVFSVGTSGKIELLTAEAKQVLTVPIISIHSADGKNFVYVVGAEGMREVRWVELGLQGNDKVEIKSGLAEGEKVVLP